MNNKLKPCPFCGSHAELESEPKEFPYGENWLHVVCTKCGASSGYYLNEDLAREAWNTRCRND